MQNFFDHIKIDFFLEPWMIQILSIVAIALILNLVANYTLFYLEKGAKITLNKWDDILIKAAKYPLATLIWVIAAKLCLKTADKEFRFFDEVMADELLKIAVILCFSWFLWNIVRYLAKYTIASGRIIGREVDHATIDALSKLSKVIIVILAILVIMQNLGFSISGILAAGGIGGLIVGFAAKDLFANFLGGLTIYLDRPFNVGDWIRSPDKEIEGTVEYIGWRHTRIRAFNKNAIYVPNAVFTTIVVENPSRMSHRRIRETIGLRYCDISKMKAITDEIREMLNNHEEIDQNASKIVNFTSFGDSSINFLLNVLLPNTEWEHFSAAKQDILLKVAAIIEANGAEIAFPTQTLYIENQQSSYENTNRKIPSKRRKL